MNAASVLSSRIMPKEKTNVTARSRFKLRPHEEETIACLRRLGYRVKLVPRSRMPGVRTPDFVINDQFWEAKAPTKCAASTLEHAFRSGSKQAENVMFDLRRLPGSDMRRPVATLRRLWRASQRV